MSWTWLLVAQRLRVTSGLVAAIASGVARAERAELPIHEQILQKVDGPARPIYAIPVDIGSSRVETGLDTGSIGLRVLFDTLKPGDATPSPLRATYGYDGGVRLDGVVGSARLSFGRFGGIAKLQLVEHVGCLAQRPDCPARQIADARDYGLEGQGIPHAGFRAIVGLRLSAPPPGQPANPLVALGASAYIVDLPRRGEGDGRLVIDPAPAERAGFVALPAAAAVLAGGAPEDTVPGCLVDRSDGRAICGAILFDTGAPGIRVTLAAGRIADWRLGTPARLILGDGHGHALAIEDFFAGPVHYGHVGGAPADPALAHPLILVGVTPYLAFSVLYDVARHSIAVRPRPAAPDAPMTILPLGKKRRTPLHEHR